MKLCLFLLLLCNLQLLQSVHSSPIGDVDENEVVSRTEERDNGTLSKFSITNIVENFHLKQLFMKKVRTFGECLSCKFAVSLLQHYANNGATEDEIAKVIYRVCFILHIETPRVCSGISNLFTGMVTEILRKWALNPNEFCSLVFGCGEFVNPLHNWTIPLTPFPKPAFVPPPPPKKDAPVLRVLQISDIHMDPYYAEGSNAVCGEPLCCRATSGTPKSASETAGVFGDYRNCDVPLSLVENMLDHINKTEKFDFVIWTGDIPPHDIWNTSREECISLLHQGCKVMHKYLGNVPIFPTLGNHESSPVNSFPIPEIKGNDSISWLYSELAEAWSQWIPGSQDSVKLGAYYTALVNPGLRIISLNTNYCNNLNWWLLLNSTDPTGQLAWLVVQLQMAEVKGEKVFIIGHIPPGQPDCFSVWSTNYYQIINRYESTVTGQFFGHTHYDEFEVFYDKSGLKPRASNVAYIGPSVTTYEGVNPGYRIYTVDGNYPKSSSVILDHETYYLNLTEANLSRKAKWMLEYSAKDDFNMTSLLPQEWDSLVERMVKDDALWLKFFRYYTKLSDYPVKPCDKVCKDVYLCKLRRGQSNAPLIC